jgi:uncharacterized protein
MEIPLFPLHTVLFPGRPLPLHIFEERYRRLLDDCLEGDRRFGVVAIKRGHEAGPAVELHRVGTIAKIETVRRLGDGRSEILTRGCDRFRLLRRLPDAPYPRAEVEPVPEGTADCDDVLAERLRALLAPYLVALGAPRELLERLPQQPSSVAYLAASVLHVDAHEQQRLLELERCQDRLASVLGLLRRENGLIRLLGAVGSLRPPGPGGPDLN